ncbi:MAG: hypothetical protein KatS3mg015_2521 [Fimbriimonadales bacterium]|nr:MAG: hypothetical protein KatS3mg015_2521 [Fimbriimonadales bacterium]
MSEPTKQQLTDLLREYPTLGHAAVAERERADQITTAARRLAEAVRPWAQGHEDCTPASEEEPFGCERAEIARALIALDDALGGERECEEVGRR